jgi:hypothetical protein
MIHFECQHCHRAVRVADTFSGKQGRCPHCDEVVQIPTTQAISALAAALASDAADTDAGGTGVRIPPPPAITEPALDDEDLPLPANNADSLADTVILPAEAAAGQAPGAVVDPFAEVFQSRPRPRAPALNMRRTLLIVAGVLIVLLVALIAFVVLAMAR